MNNNYTVYAHINKINGKIYVGITSRNPEKRWRNGKGYAVGYFSKAITKYGWDNFSHEIIASNLSKKEAQNFEILLIKNLELNNSEYGYNLTTGGEGVQGYLNGENNPMYGVSPKERMDEITYNAWINKQRELKIGAKNNNCRQVICLTTNEIFDYIKLASHKYNIQSSDITTCCKGKLLSAGKHPDTKEPMQWQYYEDYLQGIKISKYKNSRIKDIICITTNEVFNSTKEASEKYNIQSSNITLCCQGKYQKAGRHPETRESMIWMYYEEYLNLTNKKLGR